MSIRKKISIFLLLIVMLPMLITLVVSTGVFKEQVEKTEQNYLSVAMTYFREIVLKRKISIQQSGRVLVKSDKMRRFVMQRERDNIDNSLEKYRTELPFLDSVMLLDTRGNLIGKSAPEVKYDRNSVLGKAVEYVLENREPWFSEEVVLLDTLFSRSSPGYEKLLVKIQDRKGSEDAYMRKALIGLNALPVFSADDSEQVIGVMVAIDSLNNEKEFAEYFSQNIKEAFIAVSIDGIRIASNIVTEDKNDYTGTHTPTKSEVSVFKKNIFFGKQLFEPTGEMHVFLDEEVINSDGKAVAMFGVGIPEKRFNEIVANNYKSLIIISVLCGVLTLLVGSYFSKKLSETIMSIVNSVRNYGEANGMKVATLDYNDEVAVLKGTFLELIAQLANKETERKKYLREVLIANEKAQSLAEELQHNNEHLEYMVNERTQDLLMAVKELKKVDIAKSAFLANISHELRTPLNVIIGSAEILQEGVGDELTEKQLKYVNNIHESGSHLLLLINDVLDISKLATGKMLLNLEPFYVKDIVVQSINGIKALTGKKNITVKFDMEPEDLLIVADVQKFLEIMYNLLSNSAKFTEDGGKIEVNIKKQENTFSVSVKDTGIGIPPEDQERVFIEFEQVENVYTKQYAGTGLGLPIVKKLVELQEGSIVMHSEVGVGTEIIFHLPLNVEAAVNRKRGDGQMFERG